MTRTKIICISSANVNPWSGLANLGFEGFGLVVLLPPLEGWVTPFIFDYELVGFVHR